MNRKHLVLICDLGEKLTEKSIHETLCQKFPDISFAQLSADDFAGSKDELKYFEVYFRHGSSARDSVDYIENNLAQLVDSYKASNQPVRTRLLVRVASDVVLIHRLLRHQFKIIGQISARKRLSASQIEPHFPVGLFFKEALPPAIILGRANVNLLSQVRALGASGVPVVCVLTRGEPPVIVESSRYVKAVIDCRNSGNEEVISTVRRISEQYGCKPVVFTGGDPDVSLLAQIWPAISDHVVVVSDPERCDFLTDKKAQIEELRGTAIRIPESRVVEREEELGCSSELQFPVICKPLQLSRKGGFRGKIFLANNDNELRLWLSPILSSGDASILLQEFVPGGVENIFFALVDCDASGRIIHSVTGRKTADNTRGGMGIGETLRDPSLDQKVAEVFRTFGVAGILGVEFKRHSQTGELFYIESNFRPENIHSVNEAAGVNLQLSAYLRAIGCPDLYQPLPQRHATWMDFSLALLAYFKQKDRENFWPSDRKGVADALWSKKDLFPGIVWYALKFTSLLRRRIIRPTRHTQ